MTDKTIDHRLAWLAGIIDGEGWIGLGAQLRTRRGRTYKTADWYIAVGNTNAAMLAEIASICDVIGVRFSRTKYYEDRRRAGYRPQARVSVNAKGDCVTLLTAILPYLVSKRPQAELMLRAIAHRRPYKRDGTYITVEQDHEFREMVSRMSAMNRRGTQNLEG